MAQNTYPQPFTVAVHDGRVQSITEVISLAVAVADAVTAVRGGKRLLATIRDARGVMVFACDSEGRAWSPDEPAANVADWSRRRGAWS